METKLQESDNLNRDDYYKPYDIVSSTFGAVGFIQEVNVNSKTYAVNWFFGGLKYAWWKHDELTRHCNMFVKIAESSCNVNGNCKEYVSQLMGI